MSADERRIALEVELARLYLGMGDAAGYERSLARLRTSGVDPEAHGLAPTFMTGDATANPRAAPTNPPDTRKC